ncbi:hypothetical protein [Yinghuangia aomiensis]|uniref:hypothetical protein n=1 Tax=Yinghuangia aomiensis TaxID=676205 RepID=UPI0031E79EB6
MFDCLGGAQSAVGLAELANRAPERAGLLLHGSLDTLPDDTAYPVVVGIQVFQHGTRDQARGILAAALRRVAPGGLFCVRVNAVGTDIVRAHDVIGEHDDGSLTVRYRAGGHRADKAGLAVHFYSETELAELPADCEPVLPIRLTRRERPRSRAGAGRSGRPSCASPDDRRRPMTDRSPPEPPCCRDKSGLPRSRAATLPPQCW